MFTSDQKGLASAFVVMAFANILTATSAPTNVPAYTRPYAPSPSNLLIWIDAYSIF